MSLNTARLRSVLARAPRERTTAARTNPLVISLPAPNGTFHRFALVEYPIMAPGLARKHPEIKAYRGRGITDRTATIHADISPLGFHASVRSSYGAWYIDPYFVGRNPGVHASYYGRDAMDTHGPFVERESHLAELSVDKGYYHAVRHGLAARRRLRGERRDHDHDQRSDGGRGHADHHRHVRRPGLLRRELRRRSGREARRARRRGDGRRGERPHELPGRPRRRPDHGSADRAASSAPTASR